MIKAFTAFKPNDNLEVYLKADLSLESHLNALREEVEAQQVAKPEGAQWQSVGFTKICDEWVLDCERNIKMLVVAIADRVLPGAVLRTSLAAKVREVEKKEQRKLGKKEIMRLKDDILPALLDKSHVKVMHVPVLLSPKFCIVGSASVRVVDTVVDFVNSLLCDINSDTRMNLLELPHLPTMLNAMLRDTSQYDFIDLGDKLNLNAEAGTIKFAETDLGSEAVTQHLIGTWSVNSIQLRYGASTIDEAFVPRFTVDVLPVGLFRGFKLSGMLTSDIKSHLGESDDQVGTVITTAWMLHAEISEFLEKLLKAQADIEAEQEGDDL
jgi:recombination associated protein RdgC